MAGHVNHDRAGQDQNVVFPLGDIHTVGVAPGNPRPLKSKVPRRSRFDGRAAIAADTGSGRIDQRHNHFLTAIVLAGASLAEPAGAILLALQAELRGRFGADRARDGGRLVPGQELEPA